MAVPGAGKCGVSLDRVAELTAREEERFVALHPSCAALAERASGSLLGGAPMIWMAHWPGPFPVFMREATGSCLVCADGRNFVDFCMGDQAAMTGHGPAVAVRAMQRQAASGLTTMLPTEDGIVVAEELAVRFGLPVWQFTVSATDANRSVIRLARMLTGRKKVLVFEGSYHGTLDETLVTGLPDGRAAPRPNVLDPCTDAAATSRVAPFNDLGAVERALAHGDVAAVVAEPVMTNNIAGIVHPEAGFHSGLRELTEKNGALLVLDETHTLCAGPGGYTRLAALNPDAVVLGKPLASGMPVGAYGMKRALAQRILAERTIAGLHDLGSTMGGSALSMAVIRATLLDVLNEESYQRMIPLAQAWEKGVEQVVRDAGLPWRVSRLGCRAEYSFIPNGLSADTGELKRENSCLQRLSHLYAMNRGVLLHLFRSTAIMTPSTTSSDIAAHDALFHEMVGELVG